MRKATVLLGALQLLLVAPAAAQDAVTRLFPARPTGYVTDVANVLDDATEARITARLKALDDSTGGQLAVVTLPTIGDQAAGDVALAIGRAWGVGRAGAIGERRNTGAVFLLVPRGEGARGAVEIRTAGGVEGFLTDARSGQILDVILPQLREGDYGGAVERGANLIADVMAGGLGPDTAGAAREGGGDGFPKSLLLFLIIVIVFAILVAASSGGRGTGGGGGFTSGRGRRTRYRPHVVIGGGGFGGGSFGGGGFGGGGFGGFGGGGGFSGGGAGRGF